jgi:hypothetical protein
MLPAARAGALKSVEKLPKQKFNTQLSPKTRAHSSISLSFWEEKEKKFEEKRMNGCPNAKDC